MGLNIYLFSPFTHSLFPCLCLHQLGGRVQRLAGGQYLEIQEMRPEDGGQYSCVVTNMAGSSSLFFTIDIVCKSYLDKLLFPGHSFL